MTDKSKNQETYDDYDDLMDIIRREHPALAASIEWERKQIARAKAEVAIEAKANADVVAKVDVESETPRVRLYREAEERTNVRAIAVITVCQDYGLPEETSKALASRKPLEEIESELARLTGRMH